MSADQRQRLDSVHLDVVWDRIRNEYNPEMDLINRSLFAAGSAGAGNSGTAGEGGQLGGGQLVYGEKEDDAVSAVGQQTLATLRAPGATSRGTNFLSWDFGH